MVDVLIVLRESISPENVRVLLDVEFVMGSITHRFVVPTPKGG